jgi:hypothetical protein
MLRFADQLNARVLKVIVKSGKREPRAVYVLVGDQDVFGKVGQMYDRERKFLNDLFQGYGV